jgi:hypothetical protein
LLLLAFAVFLSGLDTAPPATENTLPTTSPLTVKSAGQTLKGSLGEQLKN